MGGARRRLCQRRDALGCGPAPTNQPLSRNEVCRDEVEFGRQVNRLAQIFGEDNFRFIPKTFVIPGDRPLLNKAIDSNKNQCYVIKPDGGSQGDGIYLTQDVTQGNLRHSECVVQEYIANPLLLGGLKFDLRIYVLLTSLEPLRFYVCREGLARFAVEPYERPSKANFHKLNMHLTNYSLNKFSKDFVPNTNAHEDQECSKRSITTAFEQLRAEYGSMFDEEALWERIRSMCDLTLSCIAPTLLLHSAEHSRAPGFSSHCFQVLGFDVLIDDTFEPYLLEINQHPSLQCDAPVDLMVKSEVLRPLVRMVSYGARERKLRKKGKSMQLTKAEWEDAHRGKFLEAGDGSENRHLVVPFLSMKDLFIETCSLGKSVTLEMNRSRVLKLARRMGWVQAKGAIFSSSAELELLVMKRMNATGLRVLTFFDFITFLLEDVGNLLFPGDPSPMSTQRLHNMASLLQAAPVASSVN